MYSFKSSIIKSQDSQIPQKISFIFDLEFNDAKRHIEYDEYFCTLATIIDLISQNVERLNKNLPSKEFEKINKINLQELESLKDELLYLQKNYFISQRDKK